MTYSKHPLMRSQMEKVAFSFGDFKQIATSTPVMTAGAMMALEGGTGVLSSGVAKLKSMYERNSSYKEMLEMSPELRSKDQATVKRYFNSLHRLNPHFMNDPLVAGGIVQQAVESQEAMGGLKAPALAVSRMAGDLVKNRSDFASALQREAPARLDIGRHLNPIIQAGFEHSEKMRLGQTPEALQMAAFGEAKKQHEQDLAGFAERRAKVEAAFSGLRDRNERVLNEQREKLRANQARIEQAENTPPRGSTFVSSRRGGGASRAARDEAGALRAQLENTVVTPGRSYVSPPDHPYPGGVGRPLPQPPRSVPREGPEEYAERLMRGSAFRRRR